MNDQAFRRKAGLPLIPVLLLIPALALGQLASEPATGATDTGAAVPVTTQTAGQKADEETFVLSPFEVRAEKDEGYLAQNTASGSRLNASLKNTPAPISVFTTEFLQDIAATDMQSLAQYAMNTGQLEGFQAGAASGSNITEYDPQFRIRGLPASSNTGRSVDFFKTPIEIDTFNTERVEFARGPNSILFGVGSAAGNFNSSSKKADVRRPRYEFTIRTDSNDGMRYAIDLNQPIIRGKVGLRLNLLEEQKNSWRPHEHKDAERLALAVRYQITPKTTLDVSMEKGHIDQGNHRLWVDEDHITDWIAKGRQLDPVRGAPYPNATATSITTVIGAHWTLDATTGAVTNWASQTQTAPTSHLGTATVAPNQRQLIMDFDLVPKDMALGGAGLGADIDYYTYTAIARAEPVKNLFLEVAFNKQDLSYITRDIISATSHLQYDTNAQRPDGTANPNAGKPYIEGTWTYRNRYEDSRSARATLSYEFELGQGKFGKHRVAAMAEQRDEVNQRTALGEKLTSTAPVPGSPEAATNSLYRRIYVDLSGPVGLIALPDFRETPMTGSGTPVTTDFIYPAQNAVYDYKFKFTSLMAATQSHFFKDRLVATLGYREDSSDSYYSDSVRAGAPLYGYTLAPFTAVRLTTPTKLKGSTRSQGVVYHAVKNVSLFYNRSSNFSLPNPQIILFPGTPAPTTKGISEDYGVKISLLEERLYATVARYETAAQNDADFGGTAGVGQVNNIWTTLNTSGILAANGLVLDDLTVRAGGNSFDSNSSGYEVEIVANPVRNWRLSLNYSQNKTVRTNIGRAYLDYLAANNVFWTQGNNGRLLINGTANQMAANAIDATDGLTTIAETIASLNSQGEETITKPEGARETGSPTASANLRTNYTFSEGVLKGFSVGGGGRWRDKRVIGYTSSDPATRELIYGSDNLYWDLNLGYRRKIGVFGKGLDWSLQLNVNNLFDNDAIDITSAFDDGAPRQYRLVTPREFILTSTFRF